MGVKKQFFEYKSAELKKFSRKYLMRALIFSLAFHVVVVGAWFISSAVNDANADKFDNIIVDPYILVNEIPPPVDEKQAPMEIEQTQVIPKKDLEALIPVPTSKQDAEELTTKTQESLDAIKDIVSRDGDENGSTNTGSLNLGLNDNRIGDNIKRDPPEIKQPDKPFETFEVDKPPVTVNLSEVKGSMNYPQSAIDNGTEGNVVVKVLVDKHGDVVKIGSISGPAVFKDEVREKVRNLKFVAARKNGENVKCWVSVPFKFELKNGF